LGASALRASRANAHSENKDDAALPAPRAAAGLCAVEGLRARPPSGPLPSLHFVWNPHHHLVMSPACQLEMVPSLGPGNFISSTATFAGCDTGELRSNLWKLCL
jgi:hypothetical protein